MVLALIQLLQDPTGRKRQAQLLAQHQAKAANRQRAMEARQQAVCDELVGELLRQQLVIARLHVQAALRSIREASDNLAIAVELDGDLASYAARDIEARDNATICKAALLTIQRHIEAWKVGIEDRAVAALRAEAHNDSAAFHERFKRVTEERQMLENQWRRQLASDDANR